MKPQGPALPSQDFLDKLHHKKPQPPIPPPKLPSQDLPDKLDHEQSQPPIQMPDGKQTERVKDWVNKLQEKTGSFSEVPGLLSELLKDTKCRNILVPHLYRLCAGGEPPQLEAGQSTTGAHYDAKSNQIVVCKTKVVDQKTVDIPKYHQLWAFLFETCNALNRKKLWGLIKRPINSRDELTKYGLDKTETEAEALKESSALAQKLWDQVKAKKDASLDDDTSKQLEEHKHLTSGGWLEKMKTSAQKPSALLTLPESMCSPHLYAYEKLKQLTSTEVNSLIRSVYKAKQVDIPKKLDSVIKEAAGLGSKDARKIDALAQIMTTLDPTRKVSLKDFINAPNDNRSISFREFIIRNYELKS